MPAEVVDTNVLVLATAAEQGWTSPRVPTDDTAVLAKVFQWASAFRGDASRQLVMDFPRKTILLEYKNNLPDFQCFGRRVVQHKFDTGALSIVDLDYWMNGNEAVAVLPTDTDRYFHDLGDRKMVAAASKAVAPIVNATDGDWTEPDVVAGLRALGVTVIELLDADERRACRERP